MAADIQSLTEHNNQTAKLLSSMKNKGAEAAIKQAICISTAEIKALID